MTQRHCRDAPSVGSGEDGGGGHRGGQRDAEDQDREGHAIDEPFEADGAEPDDRQPEPQPGLADQRAHGPPLGEGLTEKEECRHASYLQKKRAPTVIRSTPAGSEKRRTQCRCFFFSSAAAIMASTTGAGSKRTGSVAGSPVSLVARATASRAARSSRSNVFRHTAITLDSRTGRAASSYTRMSSGRGGILTQGARPW